MTDIRPQPPGRLLADALDGAWRAAPGPSALTPAELETVAPLLTRSGAAALAWRKLKATPLSSTPAALALRDSYRFQTLRAALHERDVERCFALLGRAGVDAVLVKGWAAARLYAEPGLRPAGDIDLCVRPAHARAARHALEGAGLWVDLHEGVGEETGMDFEAMFARAETVTLGGALVRVPRAEDHLRLLCLHLLRHGAWRPLWLCDVAAALEHRPENFDWSIALGEDRRRARWVECAVGLARALLGARVEETPFARAPSRLPRWLLPEVLRQWATPYADAQAPMRYRAPVASHLRHLRRHPRRPAGLFGDLRRRWPNPIEATVRTGGPFNALPRWPFQLANCLARAARFAARRTGAAANVEF